MLFEYLFMNSENMWRKIVRDISFHNERIIWKGCINHRRISKMFTHMEILKYNNDINKYIQNQILNFLNENRKCYILCWRNYYWAIKYLFVVCICRKGHIFELILSENFHFHFLLSKKQYRIWYRFIDKKFRMFKICQILC